MLSAKIREELTDAMRAKDSLKMNTLRGLLSAFTNELVSKGIKPQEQIADADALNVIKRAVKQRKDSIQQFKAGNREDLAQKEEAEMKILEEYMPAQMSREQIEVVAKQVKEKMAKTAEGGSPDATQNAAFRGKLVGAVMKELKGQTDGTVVKEVIESLL
ncbi:MAG: GatB/YqeY domain-containing protein [bacterium]|nr:GatB/YqeY domain-containing protein [bacterium]